MNTWRLSVIGALGLTLVMQACVSMAEFPENGSPTFKQSDEFGALKAKPASYKGVAVRMAGRIVDVVEQPSGETLILAEWLPFPGDSYAEPTMPRKVANGVHRRFLLLFPGKIDTAYEWKGNTFVAAAKAEGVKELSGNRVPYLVGSCLRLWTTGIANTSPVPWEDGGGKMDDLMKTYCFR